MFLTYDVEMLPVAYTEGIEINHQKANILNFLDV